MDAIWLLLTFGGGLALIYALGFLFAIPLKIIVKLIVSGVIGFALLFLINLVGSALCGFTLALNPINALIAGFLGLPGVALLVVIKLLL